MMDIFSVNIENLFSKDLENFLIQKDAEKLKAIERINELIDAQIHDVRELYQMIFEVNFKKMVTKSNMEVMKKRKVASEVEVIGLIIQNIDKMIEKLQESVDAHDTVGMSDPTFVDKQQDRITGLINKRRGWSKKMEENHEK